MSEVFYVKAMIDIVNEVGITAFLEHTARAFQVLGDRAEHPDKFYQIQTKLDELADEQA